VPLVRKAADKNHDFFRSFGAKKINELVVTSKKLTNNFAGLVATGVGPDVARGPPVGPRWPTYYNLKKKFSQFYSNYLECT
jgi:hypothetical protein